MLRRSVARLILSSALVLLSTTWSHAMDDTTFTVRKDVFVRLPDGTEFAFRQHGHKRMPSGGPASPLLVAASFRKDTLVEDHQLSLQPDERDADRRWSWGAWTFQLLEFEYDRSMTIRAWKDDTSGGSLPKAGRGRD